MKTKEQLQQEIDALGCGSAIMNAKLSHSNMPKLTEERSVAKWITQVKGDVNGQHWEISVIREDNEHGRASWGWFDETKLLVSHNGGHCQWPLAPGLGPVMIEIAHRLCDYLNSGNCIEDLRLRMLSAETEEAV